MKQEKENFELVKESEDEKENYIFQKDKTTKTVTFFVIGILIILIIAVILSSFFFN
ncbi:hypothetical protein SAMN05428642_101836 [Flaviramulus basaltis]|uniref:Uncharacterized protein n=1 Tax=Flaviramulus basaltis TaxID=369401 RepID=A0A1K2IEY0_9FLAO|nr:hypothetical protein [Flaviramulus basaltis]SFZ90267.1 hypothetical protein SAMN05428642_101836 [Flaviramulus basaltis]